MLHCWSFWGFFCAVNLDSWVRANGVGVQFQRNHQPPGGEAWKEEVLDGLIWKDERGPLSIRWTLEPVQRQHWGNFWETGWSACGHFWVQRYHLEPNWTPEEKSKNCHHPQCRPRGLHTELQSDWTSCSPNSCSRNTQHLQLLPNLCNPTNLAVSKDQWGHMWRDSESHLGSSGRLCKTVPCQQYPRHFV